METGVARVLLFFLRKSLSLASGLSKQPHCSSRGWSGCRRSSLGGKLLLLLSSALHSHGASSPSRSLRVLHLSVCCPLSWPCLTHAFHFVSVVAVFSHFSLSLSFPPNNYKENISNKTFPLHAPFIYLNILDCKIPGIAHSLIFNVSSCGC